MCIQLPWHHFIHASTNNETRAEVLTGHSTASVPHVPAVQPGQGNWVGERRERRERGGSVEGTFVSCLDGNSIPHRSAQVYYSSGLSPTSDQITSV